MPRFSIATPVFNTAPAILNACLRSVFDQTFRDWELCIADDFSSAPHVHSILKAAASDPRVKVTYRSQNGGIAAASNDAIAIATGEFVALLDHDDLLAPSALCEMAAAIDQDPTVDYLYSDEDLIDLDGHCVSPFYKPDWSPERFRAQNYTCHLSVIRRDLLVELGGFRPGFEGSQDYDLFLRVVEKARCIRHVPSLLYHWRMSPTSVAGDASMVSKPFAAEAGRLALVEHCRRTSIDADVEWMARSLTYRIRRRVHGSPLVSVVIPTRGSEGEVWGRRRCFVVECVRALLQSSYKNLEIVVIVDSVAPRSILEGLRSLDEGRLRIVDFDAPFNFSEKIDIGVAHSSGSFILMLNDDIEPISSDWIETMLALCQEPGVGMVGAKLLFSDRTLQHAGHVYAGEPYHIFFRHPDEEMGPSRLLAIEREVSGVTAACAMVPRHVFDEVGGLTVCLPSNFNDVDFSLKVRSRGYRIVWTPFAQLFHFESKTRDSSVAAFEIDFIHRRWDHELKHDPYHNPNLEPFRDDWRPLR